MKCDLASDHMAVFDVVATQVRREPFLAKFFFVPSGTPHH